MTNRSNRNNGNSRTSHKMSAMDRTLAAFAEDTYVDVTFKSIADAAWYPEDGGKRKLADAYDEDIDPEIVALLARGEVVKCKVTSQDTSYEERPRTILAVLPTDDGYGDHATIGVRGEHIESIWEGEGPEEVDIGGYTFEFSPDGAIDIDGGTLTFTADEAREVYAELAKRYGVKSASMSNGLE